MTSLSLFCAICGAANPAQADECFTCGQSLEMPLAKPLQKIVRQRYLILEQIGQGGFGAVYKASDSQLGDRLLAIKEMSQNRSNGQDIQEELEQFKHEAMLLAGLMHPNLPRIYDAFTEDGRWYLVMDFIEGQTLEDYLEQVDDGKLPLKTVLEIGIQLCSVLDYLHTRQPPIIFRDLKPGNIMHTSRGQLYLIDFGIARHFKPGQLKDTIAFGSPGYAAPEQYGKAQTTPAADIYSLGALLHVMLTGIDPSITPFCFDPLHVHNIQAPKELESLLTQMVEINAGKRPASAADVKEQLQQVQKLVMNSTTIQSVPDSSTQSNPIQKRQQTIYSKHTNSITSLAWSPDGTRIVSGDRDNMVHIWNAFSGELLTQLGGFSGQLRWHNAIAWSPQGIHIALFGEGDEKTTLQWDPASGERILYYYERRKRVGAIAWSPNSRYVALGNNDRMVQIRDIARGEIIFTYCGHREALRLNRVNAVAWSPNGLYVASGTRSDGVHVWQVSTGTTIQIYGSHAAELMTLAWSPDGKYIASGGGDDTVQVWEAATKKRIFTYHGHAGTDTGISAIAWSPDGTRIASSTGGDDTTVQIWEAFSGNNAFIYTAHTEHVNVLAWSSDGMWLASGGNDRKIHVWSMNF
ncbi:MAG TPA: serine/threonine-protein kinase [Ktedonobacteraceae bacterium]